MRSHQRGYAGRSVHGKTNIALLYIYLSICHPLLGAVSSCVISVEHPLQCMSFSGPHEYGVKTQLQLQYACQRHQRLMQVKHGECLPPCVDA